jgi:chemotaxis protein CheD
VLPDSAIDAGKAAAKPAMFVDSGMLALLRAARELGARDERLVIHAAGGAQIIDGGPLFDIGGRNIDALKAFLVKNLLAAGAAETGGLAYRTLYLEIATGETGVTTPGQTKELKFC